VAAGGPQDVVLNFGQLYNSGIFTLSADFFVNSGKGAYYNIQGATTIGNLWALNVHMDAGDLSIDDGTTPNLCLSAYPEGTWFNFKIEVNLTLHVWKAYVNNALVGTWVNGVNSVASADFYPLQNNQFFMDNVSFDHQSYTLSALNAMVASLDMGGVIAGQSVTPTISILNAGQNALTSFDVNLNYNGQNYTQNITGVNVASIASYTLNIPALQLAAGLNNAVVTISNINGGNDDNAADNTLTQEVDPVVPAAGKILVGEEATGTWCQWCPRGAVFMDMFAADYHGFWAGIAVHNGDRYRLRCRYWCTYRWLSKCTCRPRWRCGPISSVFRLFYTIANCTERGADQWRHLGPRNAHFKCFSDHRNDAGHHRSL
jgi:hypothetical protein